MPRNNTTPRQIIGHMTKQQWGGRKGDDAILVGEEEFDATNAILLMPHGELIELQDSDDSTDQIGRDHVQWDGPCEVRIVDSICEYFGVEDLRELSVDAFEKAKELAKPKAPKTQSIALVIKVDVQSIDGASINEFIENLDYSVRSNTPGVIVKDTEIVDSDDLPLEQSERPRE